MSSEFVICSESPLRARSHASEGGSPTLEQALLMGRDSPGSDAGYGSFQSGIGLKITWGLYCIPR